MNNQYLDYGWYLIPNKYFIDNVNLEFEVLQVLNDNMDITGCVLAKSRCAKNIVRLQGNIDYKQFEIFENSNISDAKQIINNTICIDFDNYYMKNKTLLIISDY